ncbi:hypothetical protein [Microbulbifer epialgicus]|uniref:DUF4360 domain-containing protein n=1 Tax=Microbulbifer epialgicus TaxID=393907 RepID=A0ABV4P649_9GAMM
MKALTIFSLSILATASATSYANNFSVNVVQQQFDCANTPITSPPGADVIRLDFLQNEMQALLAGGTSLTTIKKSCEIDYQITPFPGYKIAAIEFSTAGNYLTSPNSVNAARVRNRVNNQNETFSDQKSWFGAGEIKSDSFDNVIATTTSGLGQCGQSVFVETDLYSEITYRPVSDAAPAITNLDQGNGTFKLATVVCVPCF